MHNSANSQHHILRLKYSIENCIFLTVSDKNMPIAQNKSDAAYDKYRVAQKPQETYSALMLDCTKFSFSIPMVFLRPTGEVSVFSIRQGMGSFWSYFQ